MALRVLVIDDSVLYRITVSEALSVVPDVEVIGSALNGKIGLAKILELRPDLVTLDFEMPEMNGLEVLKALKKEKLDIGVIMVSSHTVTGGDVTIQALELGAFDFVPKPSEGQLDENRAELTAAFTSITKAFACHRQSSRARTPDLPLPVDPEPANKKGPIPIRQAAVVKTAPTARAELVLIGVSTGGPNALSLLLPVFPKDFDAPVIVVQHMPALFTASLAKSLDAKCALRVKEAEDGEALVAGTIYVTPGGRQMKLLPAASGLYLLKVNDDPPEQNCKPSADYLFRSVAQNYTRKVCAVIMTGMGCDGTLGARLLKRAGGYILVQDQASSVVFGMPKSAVDAGVVDKVCPLDQLGSEILSAVRGRRR